MIVGAPYQSGNVQSFLLLLHVLWGLRRAREPFWRPAKRWRRPWRAIGVGSRSTGSRWPSLLLGVAVSASRGGILSLAAGWALLVAFTVRRICLMLRALALLAVLAVAGFAATPSQTRVRVLNRFSTPSARKEKISNGFLSSGSVSTRLSTTRSASATRTSVSTWPLIRRPASTRTSPTVIGSQCKSGSTPAGLD